MWGESDVFLATLSPRRPINRIRVVGVAGTVAAAVGTVGNIHAIGVVRATQARLGFSRHKSLLYQTLSNPDSVPGSVRAVHLNVTVLKPTQGILQSVVGDL